MRSARILGLVAALVLVVPLVAFAQPNGQRADQFKVTGGGQVIASSGDAGPGDTVGFVAISTDDDGGARGSFQAVETSAAGRDMLIFKGVVTCLESTSANSARFGGFERGTENAFTVDVTDSSDGSDNVVVFQTSDEPCEDGNPVFDEQTLARGNLTIHNGS